MKKTIAIILSIMLVMAITFQTAAISKIAVKSITLNNNKITLKAGETSNLKATLTPANTTQVKLSYVTGNKNVATVNASGVITGVHGGTTTITVYTLNKKIFAKCTVTVVTITLKAFAVINENVPDYNTNEFTKWYEKKTSVHINWDTVPMSDYVTKLELVLAGGKYPDFFFGIGWFISPTQEVTYGTEQKVLIPLNDYIDNNSVDFKKVLADDPMMRAQITQLDGKIYSLPQINECFHCAVQQKLWINQKWLDKLGLKMPKTTEEYYQVLKAFRDKDPNGNGKKDEVPLTGGINTWRGEVYPFFVNSFIYYDFYNPYLLKGGKLLANINTPEFKNALTYMKKLYDEGLMDKASLTQDGGQLWNQVENPDAEIVGSVANGAVNCFADMNGERQKSFVAVPPLKGPAGVQTTAYYPSGPAPGAFAISKDCKYPEIAFKWADGLFSEECTLRYVEAGREGIEWRKAKPGEKGLDGKQAKYAVIANDNPAKNVTYSQVGPSNRSSEYRAAWACPQDMMSPLGGELRWYQESLKYMPYIPKELGISLHLTSQQSKDINKISALVNDYGHQSAAQFISGQLSIDKDWDKYVKTLDDMGLAKWIDIMNEAYTTELKKLKK